MLYVKFKYCLMLIPQSHQYFRMALINMWNMSIMSKDCKIVCQDKILDTNKFYFLTFCKHLVDLNSIGTAQLYFISYLNLYVLQL